MGPQWHWVWSSATEVEGRGHNLQQTLHRLVWTPKFKMFRERNYTTTAALLTCTISSSQGMVAWGQYLVFKFFFCMTTCELLETYDWNNPVKFKKKCASILQQSKTNKDGSHLFKVIEIKYFKLINISLIKFLISPNYWKSSKHIIISVIAQVICQTTFLPWFFSIRFRYWPQTNFNSAILCLSSVFVSSFCKDTLIPMRKGIISKFLGFL